MADPRAPRPVPSSIREPGTGPRGPRLAPPAPAARPDLPARIQRSRPDPNPLRLMLGVVGLASAAAFTTAMLPSLAPEPSTAVLDPAAAAAPQPPVQHVTRYVTLAPGQTAPPQSTVVVRPDPTPTVRLKVVTTTRQSGG